MDCPYCNFHFNVLAANAAVIPPVAPAICENCGAVSLIVNGEISKPTEDQMAAIKQSPAWRDVIEPARRLILRHKKARNAENN